MGGMERLPSPSSQDFEWITEDQSKELNKKSSRRLDDEGQWIEMWKIVFPDSPQPRSVYLSDHLVELVPLIREKWNHRRPEIIAHAGEMQPWQRDEVMDDIMGLFLKSLED